MISGAFHRRAILRRPATTDLTRVDRSSGCRARHPSHRRRVKADARIAKDGWRGPGLDLRWAASRPTHQGACNALFASVHLSGPSRVYSLGDGQKSAYLHDLCDACSTVFNNGCPNTVKPAQSRAGRANGSHYLPRPRFAAIYRALDIFRSGTQGL